MNKKEFLLEYQKKLGIKNLKIVDQKVNNFWDSWFEVLLKENNLTLRNFGRFEVKKVRPKEGVSPFGKYVTTPSKKVKFTAGKELREMLK